MNFWIRSQDKLELRPNPKLGVEKLEDGYYIIDRLNFDKSIILGKYNSKERALEVLDEIQEYMQVDKDNYEGANKVAYQECAVYKSDYLMIYKMPKE